MSSSRSDDVTTSVRVSVCLSVHSHSFNLEHSKHLKQDISWILQGCLMGVSGCLKGVHMLCKGCSKDAVRVFQEYSNAVFGCSESI